MKAILYKVHIFIFGYPSRSHIRDCLGSRLYLPRQKYDVGILYVCGVPIKEIAAWKNISEEVTVELLNSLVEDL